MRPSLISALSLSFFASAAQAQVSLWIPDADPQPISASVLGVGGDGRTTWELQPGTLSGTFTNSDDIGFPGTVTLVEGPSDAFYSASAGQGSDAVAMTVSCSINSGVAACVHALSEAGSVSTDTDTQTVSPFAIQLGGGSGGSAPAPTSVPAGGSQTSGVQASAGSSPGSAGAQPTGAAGGKSAAGRHEATNGLILLGIIGTVIYLDYIL